MMPRRHRLFHAALALLAASAVRPALPQATPVLPNPLLFVTQTPHYSGESDIGTATGTFSTHLPLIRNVPRGGTLQVLYPDGTLRDLLADALAEACQAGRPTCDPDGVTKLGTGNILVNGYAVREPTVHWNGDKVIFSLVRNVPTQQFQLLPPNTRWQLYEISGLGRTSQPVLTKVANQPAEYNNVAPVYGSDDQIIFATDRPITGNPIHYPQIEEYESGPTVSGLWKLNPATGDLKLLDHSPSGVFTPFVDSFGQVIFTRWDHLQQDQQALNALQNIITPGSGDSFNAFTYADENDVGVDKRVFVSDFVTQKLALNTPEGDMQAYASGEPAVPEYFFNHPVLSTAEQQSRVGQVAGTFNGRTLRYFTPANKYGRYDGLRFNLFLPWQINQDGTGHETFRHFGRHEIVHFINKSYIDDPALATRQGDGDQTPFNRRDGYFNIVEAPETGAIQRGTYVGVASPEFHSHSSGFILEMRDTGQAISENGSALEFTKLTSPASDTRYRNPIVLSDGTLIAAVDEVPVSQKAALPPTYRFKFRYYKLRKNAQNFYEPDVPLMAQPINRSFNYWDPDALRNFDGAMWQIGAVEVRTRARPGAALFPGVPALEQNVFAERGVNVDAFRQFMVDNDLALIVSRNVTRRDENDLQQPFNLRVEPANVPPGKTGAQSVKTGHAGQRIYDVAKLQIYQNDLLRGYGKYARTENGQYTDGGRRGLARPMHFEAAVDHNPPVEGPIQGSVKIAHDGSFAAFVPAGRAITWVLADKDNDAVVRERYWLKFAPGEVRVCASCHGVNERAQDGGGGGANAPEALRELLDYWKETQQPSQPKRRSDFNGDGRSDILWHNAASGLLYQLQMNGLAIGASGAIAQPADPAFSPSPAAAWKVAAVADLNNDGRADVVWRHETTGQVYGMLMNGTVVLAEGTIYVEPNTQWQIAGAGDFNADGNADLLWRNGATGDVFLLLMNGLNAAGGGVIYAEPNASWQIQKIADFNGDGRADVLWRNAAMGDLFVLLMDGAAVIGGGVIYSEPNAAWQIQAAADFNGDGRADVLWRNTATGDVFMMLMNGTAIAGGSVFYSEPNADWKIVASGDYNGDSRADILWRNAATGQVFMMLMNGSVIAMGDFVYTEPDQAWRILGP